MKKILITLGLCFLCVISVPTFLSAYVSVKGYYRKDGTYVAPHVRSNPNGLKYDNYSYKKDQGLYNKTYGTKDATWDTPTYITDTNYYEGKALYDSGANKSLTPVSSADEQKSKVKIPQNAQVIGSDWYCNTGYKTTYKNYEKKGCEKVVAPKNAQVIGSDWYCNTGYKTIYKNYEKTGCKPD